MSGTNDTKATQSQRGDGNDDGKKAKLQSRKYEEKREKFRNFFFAEEKEKKEEKRIKDRNWTCGVSSEVETVKASLQGTYKEFIQVISIN